MDDIIIPKGPQEEFLLLCEKLGIEKPVFFSTRLPEKTIEGAQQGVFTDSPGLIRKAKDKGYKACSTSNEVKVLEAKPDLLIEVEKLYKKDPMHFRASGLNQVLCKLMAKKGIAYGVSFSMLLSAEGKERAKLLGRAKQNVMLCRQYGVPVKAYSCARQPYELRDRKDLDAFLRTL